MPAVAPILANIAINLAIGVGASLLASAFAPKTAESAKSTSRGFSFELQTGEATTVSAVLGKGRARGQLIYHNSYGTDNRYLQLVIKVGHGWHDGHEALLIDEKAVTLIGSNADVRGYSIEEFTTDGTPYMWVKFYDGAVGQTADAELITRANPSGRWTSAHKMTGCAYYILTCKYDADLYGSTVPLSGSVWRGLRMFDWRDPDCVWGDPSTYVFSTNPAVIRYNYRRGIYVNGVRILGQGFSAFACDLPGYTAAANRCDESFYDPETDTTFPVFEFGREVGDDEAKLDVLADLNASYAGTSFKRGGADVPLPAQQLVSLLNLTDSDRLLGYAVQADRKGSVSTKKTLWHGQFVSADAAYALAPFTPRIDTELETLIGGRKSIALDQGFEWLQARAQMRAEIALRRQFFPATRVETFTPKAFVLEVGDPFTRVCEWGSMLMVVEKIGRVLKDGRLVGVTVTSRQWDNSIVPASGDSFVTLPAEPGEGPSPPDRTVVVSGLSVIAISRTAGGATLPYAKATWTAITDPNVDQVMIRYWPTSGTEADDGENVFANAALQSSKVWGPLQPETEFTGYAIPIRRDARLSVKTNLFTFTSTVLTTPSEVADNSVTNAQLNQALKDAIAFVVGTGEGTAEGLADRINDELDRLAGSVTTNTMASDRDRRVIQARVGDVQSAVVQEALARADADTALSTFILEVAAQAASGLAEGLFTVSAQSSPVGVAVRLALLARVTTLDSYVETGMLIDLISDGVGGYDTRIVLKAESIFFTDGSTTTQPMVFQDGILKLNLANIGTVTAGRIQNAANTSYFDLTSGAFRLST